MGVRCPGGRQAIMSCPTLMLGTKLVSSGRAASIFTRLAISTDPDPLLGVMFHRLARNSLAKDNLELLSHPRLHSSHSSPQDL